MVRLRNSVHKSWMVGLKAKLNSALFRIAILLMVLVIFAHAEQIGSLFLGTSSLGGDVEFRPGAYDVKYGVSAGFLLPVRFPGIDVHYKVRAARHPAPSNRPYDEFEYEYLSASNVLLVGKRFDLNGISLLPQGGLGLLYELIQHKWETGYMYNLLFIDYSLKLNIPSLQKHWGLLLNLEHGIDALDPGYNPENRFHLSLVYSY